MRTMLIAALLCTASVVAIPQQSGPKWQVGTITRVEPHVGGQSEPGAPAYDVSLVVGDMSYLVLYKPHDGTDIAMYRAGLDLPVLVGTDTVQFNDIAGRLNEAQILRREKASSQRQK